MSDAPWRATLDGVVVACRLTPKGGRDAINGAATLADKAVGFTEADQQIVETFASHAAIAMENARLHEQVQRDPLRRPVTNPGQLLEQLLQMFKRRSHEILFVR